VLKIHSPGVSTSTD